MQKTKKRHLEEKVMAKVSVCIKKPRNREFFNGEKISVDAEVKVLYQENETDIVGQYIIFSKGIYL